MRVLLAALLSAPLAAAAYDGGGMGLHSATSIGPQGVFYRPTDADSGVWAPGVQLRLHMTPVYALELSADSVKYSSMGTPVRVTPVQATVIGYFSPNSSFSPYLLLGGGWYPARADGPYQAQRLFGPHVGAGLELLLGSNWSIDGSYRFLWTEILDWSNPLHLLGDDFAKRGYMFTVGLNRRL